MRSPSKLFHANCSFGLISDNYPVAPCGALLYWHRFPTPSWCDFESSGVVSASGFSFVIRAFFAIERYATRTHGLGESARAADAL